MPPTAAALSTRHHIQSDPPDGNPNEPPSVLSDDRRPVGPRFENHPDQPERTVVPQTTSQWSPSAPSGPPEHWPHEPPPAPPIGTPSGTASAIDVPPRPLGATYVPPGPNGPGGSGGTTAVAPSPSRRPLALVLGCIILAVLLIGGGFAFARTRAADEAAAPTTTSAPSTPSTTKPKRTTTTESTTTDPADPTDPALPGTGGSGGSATPVDPDQVKAEVTAMEAFVEKQRGLTFKNHPEVEVLADAAFTKKVLEQFESEVPAMQKQGETLKAMGLVPADLDVVKAQKDLLGSGVLGFYDPKTKALVVRGDHVGPFFREIVAHELTHALDDQYFPLDRPDLTAKNDGSDEAFLDLVEGNARRVEYAYTDQLSAADKQQLQSEQLELGMGQMGSMLSTPMILPRILMAPYDYGFPFVKALVATHGNAGVDKALTDPPTTTEQILDEAKFEKGEAAIPVNRPKVDGEIIDEGVLGELMTGFMLHGGNELDGLGGLGGLGGGIDEKALEDYLDKVLNGEIDPSSPDGGIPGLPGGGTDGEDPLGGLGGILGGGGDPGAPGGQFGAIETVKGWGGDHYVVYRDATKGTCMKADWKMDTPADLASMEAALKTWSTTSGAVIERPATDLVRMTRCTSSAPAQK
jgi:hypothetical protein